MRMLNKYAGTLIIVSHDVELLRTCTNKIWHIDNGKVKIFSGDYDDYLDEIKLQRFSMEKQIATLEKERKAMHQSLMQEQIRAKKKKSYGEKKTGKGSWSSMIASTKKRQAQLTTGKNKKEINERKQALMQQLSDSKLPEVIQPKFSLTSKKIGNKNILSISAGSIGYDEAIISGINLSIRSTERIVILGDNGSGKSTLVKGILLEKGLTKTGVWNMPKLEKIGYVDQHYADLDPNKSVYQTISELVPDWTHNEVRKHLNDFLFRKKQEIDTSVGLLSGGEKARLSLAKIAAITPELLILDEITNNVDLETREHLIQILQNYPGALLLISHDEDFLKRIGVDSVYHIDRDAESIQACNDHHLIRS